jgi:hypothetical protein
VPEELIPLLSLEDPNAIELCSESFHPHVAIFGVGKEAREVIWAGITKDLVSSTHA